ncbi:MAG: hypothetical protein WDO70_04575 [Alphaproteobacteria bacterium]
MKRWWIVMAVMAIVLGQSGGRAYAARDASFIEPGALTTKGNVAEAIVADPKLYDAGETMIGIARRITMFFVNTNSGTVTIGEISAAGDGNVTVQILDNDCKRNGKLVGFSRCTVVLSITPTSVGPWSVETLVEHDGSGRLARGIVTGKAQIDPRALRSAEGLNLTSKEVKAVDFNDVSADGEGAVRTALMVNDSPENITLLSIEVIAAGRGLERLDQGCAVNQMLKPDESCPITLRWQPQDKGAISTDLIVRHTGKAGFTVIPVRGRSQGGTKVESAAKETRITPSTGTPAPPTAAEIEHLAGKLPAVAAIDLGSDRVKSPAKSDSEIYFIGAVGDRAIFQRDGITKVLAIDSETELSGAHVRLIEISGKVATVEVDGRRKYLKLGSSGYRPSSSLVKKDKAVSEKKDAASSNSQSSFGK